MKSNKLNELEAKMNLVEKTLAELKEAFAMAKTPAGSLPIERFDLLSDVEQKKINYILRNFDFEKVHKVMSILGWKWACVKENDGVPDVESLKAEAKRLLVDACFEKTTIATGGFKATYEATPGDPDGDEFLQLEFVLAEEEGFDSDDEDAEDATDDWDN